MPITLRDGGLERAMLEPDGVDRVMLGSVGVVGVLRVKLRTAGGGEGACGWALTAGDERPRMLDSAGRTALTGPLERGAALIGARCTGARCTDDERGEIRTGAREVTDGLERTVGARLAENDRLERTVGARLAENDRLERAAEDPPGCER